MALEFGVEMVLLGMANAEIRIRDHP